jgi:hypothetical protein
MEERGSVKMSTLSTQCISSTAAAREPTRFQVRIKLMLRLSSSHSVPLASPSRLSLRRCRPSDPPIVTSKSSSRRRCPGALHVEVVAEPPPLRRAPACQGAPPAVEVCCPMRCSATSRRRPSPPLSSPPSASCP